MIWICLTLGVLLAGVLLGLLLRKRFPKTGRTVLILTLLLVGAVAAAAGICWDAPDTDTADADYALLLGYALKDGQAQPELVRRMELALDWLEETQDIPLVVSGGDVDGDGITEAQVMVRWLEAHGADMDRIRPEPEASDTRENLLFSRRLMETEGRETDTVLILTSDYHQTRARFLALRTGQQPLGLGCETPFSDHLIAAVREVYSFLKAILETL